MGGTSFYPPEVVEKLSVLSRSKGFLGREFLTWLWFRIDHESDRLSFRFEGREWCATLWVDDQLHLDKPAGGDCDDLLRGGDPARSPEARVAVSAGKSVAMMRLAVEVDDVGPFQCSLKADDLSPRGLRVPEAPTAQDVAEKVQGRIHLMRLFVALLDALLAEFFALRADQTAWSKREQKKLHRWASGNRIVVKGSLH